MGHLVDVLYPMPDVRRTPLSTLVWWESRRWLYNRAVGLAGLATLTGVSFFFSLPPFAEGPPPVGMAIGASLLYGVAANVCYSMGWVVEMVARRLWGRAAPDMGPLLFREGLHVSLASLCGGLDSLHAKIYSCQEHIVEN